MILATVAASTNPVTKIANQFGVDIPSLAAQILCFGIVAIVLYIFAIKPVLRTLGKRQEEIHSGLKFAEDMKKQLAEADVKITAQRREAQLAAKKIIDEAKKTADENCARQQKEAAEQAAALIEKARQDMEQEKQKILSEAKAEIARLVVATTRKVLAEELTDEQRSKYNEAASKQLIQ